MAVQFDPRSNLAQGANTQANPHTRSVPSGVAGAPSAMESQASESVYCCGWVSKMCEWIRSWFTSAQPAASVAQTAFTLGQRIARGREQINEVFSHIPNCNPRRTVVVCSLRYNNEPAVEYYLGTQLERLLNESNRAVEYLLRRNAQVDTGTLVVQSFFWEKLPDGAFNTMSRTRELNFADEYGMARRAASMHENISIDPITAEIERIYNPNPDNGLAFTLRNL
jgi:hypothetical protein